MQNNFICKDPQFQTRSCLRVQLDVPFGVHDSMIQSDTQREHKARRVTGMAQVRCQRLMGCSPCLPGPSRLALT